MPLTITTYCTIEQADSFWQARGNTEWEGKSDPEKQAAIVIASDYIGANYTFSDGVLDGDEYPDSLVRATAWLALYADEALASPTDKGGEINRVKAGSVEVQWSDNAPMGTSLSYLDNLLKDITEQGNNTHAKLVRV